MTALSWVFNFVLTAVLVVVGWYVKAMRDAVDKLRDRDVEMARESKARDEELAREVASIRTLVVGDYAKRATLDEFGERIFAKLDSMRLENKQDLKDAVHELKTELAKKADK